MINTSITTVAFLRVEIEIDENTKFDWNNIDSNFCVQMAKKEAGRMRKEEGIDLYDYDADPYIHSNLVVHDHYMRNVPLGNGKRKRTFVCHFRMGLGLD